MGNSDVKQSTHTKYIVSDYVGVVGIYESLKDAKKKYKEVSRECGTNVCSIYRRTVQKIEIVTKTHVQGCR